MVVDWIHPMLFMLQAAAHVRRLSPSYGMKQKSAIVIRNPKYDRTKTGPPWSLNGLLRGEESRRIM